MQEIWIPEFLMTLFLFLHILRPLVKQLKPMAGLTWLPLLTLLIGLVLFPAYGFRPEVIPLLIYAAVLAGNSISKQAKDNAVFGSIRRGRIVFVLPPLLLLAVTAGTAFYFTPQKDLAFDTRGIYTLKAVSENNGVSPGGKEYFIRIYTDENESPPSSRPLLVLLPPVLGSLEAIDQVSGELRDRGFTVLTYSRRGFDSPAFYIPEEGKPERYGISPVEWFRRFHAFISGTVSAGANAKGRALEDARKEDLLFLLSWIEQNPRLKEKTLLFDIASRDTVFLAGYDAGGSALALLGNSLSPETIKIRGLIAIGSCFWSVYREEVPDIPVLPPEAGWLTSVQYGLNRWYLEMKSKKITDLGQIPRLSIPLLFLLPSKGRDPGGRYLAAIRTYQAARGPATLISADGVGPLDYSDFPVRYPVITAILRGRGKPVWSNLEAPGETAGLISYFAAEVLKAQGEAPSSLKKAALPAGLHVDAK